MSSPESASHPEVACSLSPAELEARLASLSELAGEARSVEAFDDGFALLFDNADETAPRLLELILSERRCCPFFRFELVFEPSLGPIRLRVGGPREARRLFGPLLAARP